MLGGTGTCTLEELGVARVVVTDLCNFFNATLYTATAECQSGGHRWHNYGPQKYDLSTRSLLPPSMDSLRLWLILLSIVTGPEMTFDLIAGQTITILDE